MKWNYKLNINWIKGSLYGKTFNDLMVYTILITLPNDHNDIRGLIL